MIEILNFLKVQLAIFFFLMVSLFFGLIYPTSNVYAQSQHSTNVLKISPVTDNFNLVQEMEVNYRDDLVLVTKKTLECLLKSKTKEMIYVCKSEENHELKMIKKKKSDFEMQYLRGANKRKYDSIDLPTN